MIAALLHGRNHLNFQEFRQQNHLTFFLHVLGILELLQPRVFQSEHQGALWDCLLSFLRLLLVGAPPTLRTLGPGIPQGSGALVPLPAPFSAGDPARPACSLHHSEFSPHSARPPPAPTTLAAPVFLTRTEGPSPCPPEAAG